MFTKLSRISVLLQATFRLEVKDDADVDRNKVKVEVTGPQGSQSDVSVEWAEPGAWCQFVPKQGGVYQVRDWDYRMRCIGLQTHQGWEQY